MKRQSLLFLFSLLLTAGALFGQRNYDSAIGAKLGYGLVASYKTFLNDNAAVDIFGGIRWSSGLAAGAYYEIHKPIESVEALSWYYGGGVSFTTWTFGGLADNSYYELGLSGVVGLDYTFEDLPLNVSVDWAPTFVVADSWDFTGSYNRFRGGYGALTARYILSRP